MSRVLVVVIGFVCLIPVRSFAKTCEFLFTDVRAIETPLGFVAESAAMRETVDAARQFAPFNIPIYLEGPTGSGKEVLAKFIHEQSERTGELVAVNLGALPKELIAAELFGHKRGAFTGAIQDHKGLVAQAEKGTLFLDEIADLTTESQLLLLRFIETRTYRPVGETRDLKADVRFVFATHKDLRSLVQQGLFREDLYNRIAVARVDLPTLRERPEDILPLAKFFLKEKATEFGKPVPELSDGAIAYLHSQPFSGNVRELAGMISRAVIVTPVGQRIEPTAFVYGTRKRTRGLEFPTISEPLIIDASTTSSAVQLPTYKSNELRQIAFIQAYARAYSQSRRGEPSMGEIGQLMGTQGNTPAKIFESPLMKEWVEEFRSHRESWRYSEGLQRALQTKLPTLNPRELINYSILYALNQPDAVLLDRRGNVPRISQSAWADSLGMQRTAMVTKMRDTNGWDVEVMVAEREQRGSIDVQKWMQKISKTAPSDSE